MIVGAFTAFAAWEVVRDQGASRVAQAVTAARLRSISRSVVFQPLTLTRIAARPCQTVGPHQQVPSWSHAAVSQAAACAIGNAPPVTKPKYRGPPLATVPGEP